MRFCSPDYQPLERSFCHQAAVAGMVVPTSATLGWNVVGKKIASVQRQGAVPCGVKVIWVLMVSWVDG